MTSQDVRSPFAHLEAIWGGIFGSMVCCLIALIPLLMVEQNFPARLPNNQAVMMILAVCLLVESVNLYRIWRAVFDAEYPFGPAVALRYRPFRNRVLRVPSILWLLFHSGFSVCLVTMCKYMAIHGETIGDRVTGLALGLAMFGAVNLFLSLTIKACTGSNEWVMAIWRYRFVFDLLIEAAALAIGFLQT
jgi:hypothetical protein